MTEAILLSLAGAAGGLVVAGWAARLARLAQPAQLAAQDYTVLDWRVLGFALFTACVTALVFGIVPAWTTGRLQPVHLTTRAGTGGGRRAAAFRAALIAVQVALTLVLVSGALAMTRGFASLMGTDLGYTTRHVATAKVSLAGTRYDSGGRPREYVREALARLRALPGVRSAAVINNLPLATSGFSGGVFSVEGGRPVMAVVVEATPDYFHTMSTPVLSGREFAKEDVAGAADVAIVNEEFEKLVASGTPLVGKELRSEGKFARVRSRTIVGVVGTALYDVKEPSAPRLAQIFVPFEQSPVSSITFVIRAAPGTADAVGRFRDVLRGVDRQVPVFDVKTLDDRVAESVTRPRFYTTVVVFFSAFALLLAVVGIYGVASYSVTRRSHEIGVRLALGSSPSRVRRLLIREIAIPLSAGIVTGIAAAAAMARLVAHFLPGEQIDPGISALATMLVVGTTLVAVRTATRRVGKLEPLSVLRAE
jgi:putative ABC transport system permease protein